MPESNYAVAPFPALTWDGDAWSGEIRLTPWAGFQERRGPYASISSDEPSDGTVAIMVAAATGEGGPATPTAEQSAALEHLLANGQSVADAALAALIERYPALQESYGYDPADAEELMPSVSDPADFRSLIGLAILHVLRASRDGVAYVGFELGCNWDDDSGLGIMMHRDRVVEIGGADASFLEWIADRDAAGQ